MNSPIFIFSTPEGGGHQVQQILIEKGYDIIGNGGYIEALLPFVDSCCCSASADLFEIAEKFFKKILFDKKVEKWGFCEHFVGIFPDTAFKIFLCLYNNIPNCKFIFCNKELDKNLAIILNKKEKWIPAYADSIKNCEINLKNQISEQLQFFEFYSDRSIIYNSYNDSKEKILDFIK